MLNKIIIACAVSLAVGCASGPHKPGEQPSEPMTATNYPLGDSEVGDSVTFREIDYSVQSHYTAASGRTCRKLLNLGTGNIQIGCRADDGEWYVHKPLAGLNLKDMEVPTDDTASPLALSESLNAVEAVGHSGSHSDTLRPNETLWRFSRRVTGKSSNWQSIAKYNGINNVKAVAAGQTLNIPPELSVNGVSQ